MRVNIKQYLHKNVIEKDVHNITQCNTCSSLVPIIFGEGHCVYCDERMDVTNSSNTLKYEVTAIAN